MKMTLSMCALVGLVSALVVTGCRRADDEFRGTVPTREAVVLHVPGAPDDGQAAAGATTTTPSTTGVVHSALLGQLADTYTVTRTATVLVNGGTWAVLTLVKTIVDFPATTVTADTAVWGPHTDALSRNTWRVTVTRLEPHKFHWLFEGRAKTATDADFVTVVSGTHTAAVDAHGDHLEGFGSGDFLIDWDAAATLPEHDQNAGKASFTYSRTTADAVVTVGVDFNGIKDDKGQPFNAVYRYTETPSAGGELQYAEDKDNYPDPGDTGSATEHFTIRSRWQQDGEGRCDLEDSGGDLGAVVGHASECWDTNFLSVYLNEDYDAKAGWGDATKCTAFPTADYAGL
jgi:hypothetical protein